MKKIRAILAACVAAFMLMLTGAPAHALTDNYLCYQNGGRILNYAGSRSAFTIYSGTYPSRCGYASLGIGKASWQLTGGNFLDTDAFYVGPQWYCENIGTHYKYYGNVNGQWYWLVNDSVYIALECWKDLNFINPASKVSTDKTINKTPTGDAYAQPGPSPK